MIYIFCSLYCEASILIKQFQLTKNPVNTRFQEFHNETEDILLTITGVGEIAAAAAVSSICTAYPPTAADLLINIGTCARDPAEDKVFLCNKIVEKATGKTFYPDVLYCHDFCEEMVITGMRPCNRTDKDRLSVAAYDGALYDMEAASIYQAGSYFFGPHQMLFIKLVSDHGNASEVSKDRVEKLMVQHQDVFCGFIRQLLQISLKIAGSKEPLDEETKQLTDRLCADMHCSKVMGDSLRMQIRYLSLTGEDVSVVIQQMYEDGLLPCKDKREGKIRFEEFKRRLF